LRRTDSDLDEVVVKRLVWGLKEGKLGKSLKMFYAI
jgi:hypothetical protein